MFWSLRPTQTEFVYFEPSRNKLYRSNLQAPSELQVIFQGALDLLPVPQDVRFQQDGQGFGLEALDHLHPGEILSEEGGEGGLEIRERAAPIQAVAFQAKVLGPKVRFQGLGRKLEHRVEGVASGRGASNFGLAVGEKGLSHLGRKANGEKIKIAIKQWQQI